MEFHFVVAEHSSDVQPDLVTVIKVFPMYLEKISVMTWAIVAFGVWQGWTTPKAPDIDL